jgi:hypothetical protein
MANEHESQKHGLDIKVDEDGVWLTFRTMRGKTATLCVEGLASNYVTASIIRDALLIWCDEEHEAARDTGDWDPARDGTLKEYRS